MKRERVVVCAPADRISGGPEVLHQLVDCLRSQKFDAAISYMPCGQKHLTPEVYAHYDSPVVEFSDERDTLFVVPEVATRMARQVSRGTVAVWWLSVDNYFGARKESAIRDLLTRLSSLRWARVPLWRLHNHLHFAQSEYAFRFLERHGVASKRLTDYLNSSHATISISDNAKEDIVAYNPLKGKSRTNALIAANPDINFIPIQGMTPIEVAALLRRAKLYIDFGHHPGKDRLPREAAAAGCCVITNTRGSAGFAEDVPSPEAYKLDDESSVYLTRFRELALAVFRDFEVHRAQFDHA